MQKAKNLFFNFNTFLDKLSLKMINVFNPLRRNLKVTKGCNFRCEFCELWQKENEEPIVPEILCQKLSEFKWKGTKEVNFVGGESLLNAELPKVLAHAKELKLKTNLYTNGLLYPHFGERLKNHTDVVYLMINHPIKEEHDRISGINSFTRLEESVTLAKELKQEMVLNANVHLESITHLPELNDVAVEFGINLWLNPILKYMGHAGFQRESKEYIKRYFLIKGVGFNLATIRKPRFSTSDFLCLAVDPDIERYYNPLNKEFYKNHYSKLMHGLKKIT